MREQGRAVERLTDMTSRAHRPIAVAALLVLAACGGGGAEPRTQSTVPPTATGVATEEPETTSPDRTPGPAEAGESALARCEDVPRFATDVVNQLDAPGQQTVLDAVLSIWQPEGPESEFGGTWVDREALGTLVVAVTEDPEPHRTAIAALLGGSTDGFDVVQVEFSQRRLTDAMSVAFDAARDAGLEVEAVARDEPRNRIRVESVVPVGDTELAAVAASLGDAGVEPLEMVCLAAPTAEEMPPVVERGSSLDVDVAADGVWSQTTVVSCLGVTFPLSVLAELAPFTDADAALSEAARPYLGGENWAPELWRYAALGPDEVILFGITTGVSIHTFMLGANGWIWTDGVSGDICDLEATLPDGLNVVMWEADPELPPPGPDSMQLSLLATERACASGQPMGDRLLDPQVVETDTAVLVTFAAIAQLGGQECPGNPSTEVTIELDAPLGDRILRDGLLVGPITNLVEPLG